MKLLFLIFICYFSYCQNIVVKYEIKNNFPENSYKDENIGEFIRQATLLEKMIEYKLIINNKMSIFYPPNVNGNDYDLPYGMTIMPNFIKIQQNDTLFIEGKSKYLPVNKYIPFEPILNDWLITEETQLIQGFLCFKAILFYNGKQKAVAWFTPDIQNKFGPNGYGGLPRLILSITAHLQTLNATEIKITKNTNIKFALKGELIEKSEYDEIINKLRYE